MPAANQNKALINPRQHPPIGYRITSGFWCAISYRSYFSENIWQNRLSNRNSIQETWTNSSFSVKKSSFERWGLVHTFAIDYQMIHVHTFASLNWHQSISSYRAGHELLHPLMWFLSGNSQYNIWALSGGLHSQPSPPLHPIHASSEVADTLGLGLLQGYVQYEGIWQGPGLTHCSQNTPNV